MRRSRVGVFSASSPNSSLTNTEMANQSIAIDTTGQTEDASHQATVEFPYRTRYATVADADAIDNVVREAFGDSAPNPSAARDMKRKNTTYIVATRGSNWDANGSEEEAGGNGGFSQRLRSMLSFSFGSMESQKAMSSVAGAVGIWASVDQAHIVVIATRPIRRGRGIGELLLIATMAEALKLDSRNVTLEVRKSNLVARALYQKYGFSDVGIRRNYYHDNREDAIIMSTPSLADLGFRRSLRSRCLSFFATRGRTELQVDPMPYLSLPE